MGTGRGSRVKMRMAPRVGRNAIPPLAHPTVDGATGADGGGRRGNGSGSGAWGTRVAEGGCRRHAWSVQGCMEGRNVLTFLFCAWSHIPQNRPYPCAPCPTRTRAPTPVCRIALPQVSPSMPTHAEAECSPDSPDGSLGVGTVKVPVTDWNVACPRRVRR